MAESTPRSASLSILVDQRTDRRNVLNQLQALFDPFHPTPQPVDTDPLLSDGTCDMTNMLNHRGLPRLTRRYARLEFFNILFDSGQVVGDQAEIFKNEAFGVIGHDHILKLWVAASQVFKLPFLADLALKSNNNPNYSGTRA